jgi:hypothetical protein
VTSNVNEWQMSGKWLENDKVIGDNECIEQVFTNNAVFK